MEIDRTPPILECHGLCKHYGGKTALANANIVLPRGRIIGLLGPNGSGKTTFIKLCAGLLTPSSGQVLINGYKPGEVTKAHVSYLPDQNYLNNWMNVTQLISFFKDFYKDFSENKAIEMLNMLNINPTQKLKTMSKGTKEKVQLILVMSRQSDLYLLDEPIAGVDPAARDYIINTIIGNYNKNATVIISTHLISDVEPVLEDVIFIRYGEVILQESTDSIRERTGSSIDAYFREVFRV